MQCAERDVQRFCGWCRHWCRAVDATDMPAHASAPVERMMCPCWSLKTALPLHRALSTVWGIWAGYAGQRCRDPVGLGEDQTGSVGQPACTRVPRVLPAREPWKCPFPFPVAKLARANWFCQTFNSCQPSPPGALFSVPASSCALARRGASRAAPPVLQLLPPPYLLPLCRCGLSQPLAHRAVVSKHRSSERARASPCRCASFGGRPTFWANPHGGPRPESTPTSTAPPLNVLKGTVRRSKCPLMCIEGCYVRIVLWATWRVVHAHGHGGINTPCSPEPCP